MNIQWVGFRFRFKKYLGCFCANFFCLFLFRLFWTNWALYYFFCLTFFCFCFYLLLMLLFLSSLSMYTTRKMYMFYLCFGGPAEHVCFLILVYSFKKVVISQWLSFLFYSQWIWKIASPKALRIIMDRSLMELHIYPDRIFHQYIHPFIHSFIYSIIKSFISLSI